MKAVGMMVLCMLEACMAFGQTNGFCDQVEAMWKSGNYSGVLAVAQQRLAENTNDIAGLLLELEYDMEYLQLDSATNVAAAIIRVAPQIQTPRFSELCTSVSESAKAIMWAATNYPPDEYAVDIQKVGTITNKTLGCRFILRALEEDGYFNGSAPTPTPSAPN